MTGQVVGGLDGCAAGWVLVTVPADGPAVRGRADALGVAVVADLDAVVADLESGRMAAAAIDIPIGLGGTLPGEPATPRHAGWSAPGGARSSRRPCAACSARRPTTRPAPSRARLRAGDLEAAVQHPGQDPRGRPAPVAPAAGPALRDAPRVELHRPRRRPDAATKRTAEGRAERAAALRAAFGADAAARPSGRCAAGGARRDDVLDAWSAPGRPAATWPGPTCAWAASCDERGLRMEMIA